MPKKKDIPMSLRPKPEVREKLEHIAEINRLSLTDIAHMALAAGLPLVEVKLREINEPKPV